MADKVKISDSTNTTSSVIAASCTAVKTVMDKVNEVNNCLPLTGGAINGKLYVNDDLVLDMPGSSEGGQIILKENGMEQLYIDRANNLLRFFGGSSKKVVSFDPATGILNCPYSINGISTSAYSVKSEAIAYGRTATGFTLPDGGTWFVFATMDNRDGSTFACPTPVVAAGGTTISWNPNSGKTSYIWIAIKVF